MSMKFSSHPESRVLLDRFALTRLAQRPNRIYLTYISFHSIETPRRPLHTFRGLSGRVSPSVRGGALTTVDARILSFENLGSFLYFALLWQLLDASECGAYETKTHFPLRCIPAEISGRNRRRGAKIRMWGTPAPAAAAASRWGTTARRLALKGEDGNEQGNSEDRQGYSGRRQTLFARFIV